MKRNYLYYLLTILFLAVSCEKDEMACTTTVETQEVSSIAATTAQCGGIISSDGNPTIKEAGVECCTTSDFENNVSCHLADKAKLGKFACEITDLKDNTQYYVRAYARNSYSTIYGEVLSFKTLEIILPAVLTDSVTNISPTSTTVGGEVTNDGNGEVAERGVVYSTTSNPTTSNSKVVSGSGKGSFTCILNDLQESTTYYVRAYAVNEKGTAYGEETSFTTKAIVVPTVTTSSATNISYTSATVGGTVTEDGGATITERGVVYSTTPNPTTSNSKVVGGSGKGSFTCNLSNLQVGVTYYVRAYAANQRGTAYGEEKSFTTKAITIPTVTTSSARKISIISATIGGNVTDDGGATVTERGVVYSTTPNPTTSNSKVSSGSGKGAFSCNLNDLQKGTTYYVRAYAVNQKGTAYGEEKSITTKIGAFSVSSSKQVVFSSGNLQYTQSTNTWSFAENQWDYIGTDNVTGGSVSSDKYGDDKYGTALADKVDLFGWSTDATNFGVSTSEEEDAYSGSFVDWGTNKIGNDAPNTWRTLTYDEWKYLLNTRPNASSLKGVAQVNGMNGLIFLPDSWTCPSGVTFKSGFHNNYGVDYYAAYQTFTADQWSKLESAGAVFLPAAGHRKGSRVYGVQGDDFYWSATEYNSGRAYRLSISSSSAYMGSYSRYFGVSVRLVKDL